MAVDQRSSRSLLLNGVIGGIIAGIIFMAAEMLASVMTGGVIIDPLRLIASIVLSADALSPTYSVGMAAITGTIVHLVLSAIYGVIFVYLLAYTRQLNGPPILLLVYGSVFGFALWIINYLVIGAIVWPQFTLVNQFWSGFIPHTYFYGSVLGAYVATTVESVTGKATS